MSFHEKAHRPNDALVMKIAGAMQSQLFGGFRNYQGAMYSILPGIAAEEDGYPRPAETPSFTEVSGQAVGPNFGKGVLQIAKKIDLSPHLARTATLEPTPGAVAALPVQPVTEANFLKEEPYDSSFLDDQPAMAAVELNQQDMQWLHAQVEAAREQAQNVVSPYVLPSELQAVTRSDVALGA